MPVTNFIWDQQQYLVEADDSNAISVVYTSEPREHGFILSSRALSTHFYYHFDATASTRQLSTADQNISDSLTYDSWGNSISHVGSASFSLRWAGQVGYYLDSETGMLYVRSRHYNPATARWQQVDPMWTFTGHGKYVYVLNSPINHIDPSGMCHICTSVTFDEAGDTLKDLDKKYTTGKTPFQDMAEFWQKGLNANYKKSHITIPAITKPGIIKQGNAPFKDTDDDGNEFDVPKGAIVAGNLMFFNAFLVCNKPKCGLKVEEMRTDTIGNNQPTTVPDNRTLKLGDHWTTAPLKPDLHTISSGKLCDTLIVFADAPGGNTVIRDLPTQRAATLKVSIDQTVILFDDGGQAGGVPPQKNAYTIAIDKKGEVTSKAGVR